MSSYSTTSQLIKELQSVLDQHGDIPVLLGGHSYQHGGTTCYIDSVDVTHGATPTVRLCGIEVD